MCGDYTHRTVLDKIQSYNDCHGPKSQIYSKRTTKIRQHGFIARYWTSESVFLFQEVFHYCLPELKGWILGEGQLCTDPRLMFLSEIFYWLLLETGYWSRQLVVWPSGFLEVFLCISRNVTVNVYDFSFGFICLSSIFFFNAVFIKCLILLQPYESKVSFNAIPI